MNNERKESFKAKFQKHYPRLCNIAYGYVSDRHDAEDIVQEAFINVWNKGKDNMPEQEFAAYMTMAIKNNCITFLRKRQQNTISLNNHEIQSEVTQITETTETYNQPEQKLQEALSMLPPKCKDIFLMAKLQGMKYRDIAQTLGLSEKTIENQMTKAIKILRSYVATHVVHTLFIGIIILSFIIKHI